MAIKLCDNERHVIPRWHESRAAITRAEILPILATPKRNLLQEGIFKNKINDWLKNKTLSFASDLVGSAIVMNVKNDVANDAAEFILNNADASISMKSLAIRLLGGLNLREFEDIELAKPSLFSTGEADLRAKIALLKKSLNLYPHNPIAWLDMALAYTILGFNEKAARCINIALPLAPTNRFIIRSAARFFLHSDDPEHAVYILQNSEIAKSDPWIVAAEIAISGVAKKSSKFANLGRKLIESKNIDPIHMTELASALATLNLESGENKKAKKLFKRSLILPNENAVAQAEWISSNSLVLDIDLESLRVADPFEASAKDYCSQRKWKEAFEAARAWFVYQPFTAEPAILCSYIASVIGDSSSNKKAINTLKAAIKANPKDWILRNNLTVLLTMENDIINAEEQFKLASSNSALSNMLAFEQNGTLLATKGFIKFRKNCPDIGRELYLQAINKLANPENARSRAIAAIMLAKEEIRAKTGFIEEAYNRAFEISKNLSIPEVKEWLAQLEDEYQMK